MIDLVFGLHLYQPPNQDLEILKKITEESYLPLIDLILSHPRAHFTVDIARSAIEGLGKDESGNYFLKKFKTAVDLKKISLVNTAAYHPILPLLPEEEIIRQIKLNEEVCQKTEGFFLPEMAFSPKLAPILQGLGYKWTITADTPFVCCYNHNPEPPFAWIPKQKNLAVFLRSDFWSNKIAFHYISGSAFIRALKHDLKNWFGGNRGYLIVWLDWETFGHHRPNFIQKFLTPLLDNLNEEVNLCSPSELLVRYPTTKELEIPSGSWSTSAQDFYYKNYWPLWNSPHIEFHRLWWELAIMILEIKKNVKSEEQLSIFDKTLYSCQTWQWSYGNKPLAIKGMEYFKEILKLEETIPYLHLQELNQRIEKLESLCKQ